MVLHWGSFHKHFLDNVKLVAVQYTKDIYDISDPDIYACVVDEEDGFTVIDLSVRGKNCGMDYHLTVPTTMLDSYPRYRKAAQSIWNQMYRARGFM